MSFRNGLLRALRYGPRSLRKKSGVTLIAVMLSIGLTTMLFSVINGFFLKGLPFPDSNRLYMVNTANKALNWDSDWLPSKHYYQLFEEQDVFKSLSGNTGNDSAVISKSGNPESFRATFVTWNWLDTLRVHPLLGRSFLPGSNEIGAVL
jgi:putative ABC transport system permease protein